MCKERKKKVYDEEIAEKKAKIYFEECLPAEEIDELEEDHVKSFLTDVNSDSVTSNDKPVSSSHSNEPKNYDNIRNGVISGFKYGVTIRPIESIDIAALLVT